MTELTNALRFAGQNPLFLIAFLALVLLLVFRQSVRTTRGLHLAHDLLRSKLTKAEFAKTLNRLINLATLISVLFFLIVIAWMFVSRSKDSAGGGQSTGSLDPQDKHHAIVAGAFGVHFSIASGKGDKERVERLREPLVKAYALLGFDTRFYEKFVYGTVPHDALRTYVTLVAANEAEKLLGPEASAALRFGNQMALAYGVLSTAADDPSIQDFHESVRTGLRFLSDMRANAALARMPASVDQTLREVEILAQSTTPDTVASARAKLRELFEVLTVTDLAVPFLSEQRQSLK